MNQQHREPEEWVPINDLVPWAANPRINDASADTLVEVIQEFGFLDPLIARRDTKELIAGHTRLKAAKRLGMESVPVIWMDIDDDQSQRLALIHNKAAEKAEWDPLALVELHEGGLDLLDAGFSEVELDELLESTAGLLEEPAPPKSRAANPDSAPAPRRLSVALHLFVDDADELEDLIAHTALPGETRANTIIRALDQLRQADRGGS